MATTQRKFEGSLDKDFEVLRRQRQDLQKSSRVLSLYDFVLEIATNFVAKITDRSDDFMTNVATANKISLVSRKRIVDSYEEEVERKTSSSKQIDEEILTSRVSEEVFEEPLTTSNKIGIWKRPDGTILNSEEIAGTLLCRSIDVSTSGWTVYFYYNDGSYLKRTLGNPLRCYLERALRYYGCVGLMESDKICNENWDSMMSSRTMLKDLIKHPYVLVPWPGNADENNTIEKFRNAWPKTNGSQFLVVKGMGENSSNISLKSLYEDLFAASPRDQTTSLVYISLFKRLLDALALRGKALDGPECDS